MEKSIEERTKSITEWILRREGCLKSAGLNELIGSELVKQRTIDIEKACEYLKSKCDHMDGECILHLDFNLDGFIRAMED